MAVKAVIFDLDGTLTDTIPLTIHSLREVSKSLTGIHYSDEEILREFGIIDTEMIKKFVREDQREQSVELYIQHFIEHFHQFVKPIDGIEELLHFIHSSGIKTALFTGRSYRSARIVLEKMNILQHFDILIAGDHTSEPKPSPEGILMALDKLEAKPEESIYVGDFDVDIKASRAAGTKSVLALWSSTGSERLIDLKPDQYFRNPYEFIDWLKSKNSGVSNP